MDLGDRGRWDKGKSKKDFLFFCFSKGERDVFFIEIRILGGE